MNGCCDYDIVVTKKESTSISPILSGEQRCEPGHFWGAGVRPYYLMHYIISGSGTFYCGTNKYELSQGDAFFIFPHTIVKYQASQNEPWHYCWVAFSGEEASAILKNAGITAKAPVISPKDTSQFKSLIRSMPEYVSGKPAEDLHFTSILYELLSLVSRTNEKNAEGENSYFSAAIQYINNNFSEDITVDGISDHLGISRKYLYALFKSACGKSPKEYILDYRMQKACEFLHDKELPISSISYSVGYPDQFVFSKMFKAKIGVSPNTYRKSL